MRNQESNPLIEEFQHLLSDDGRYPEQHVDIFWNKAEGSRRIKDVEVVFAPREALKDSKTQIKYSEYNHGWTHDLGNSLSGWLSAGSYTPAGIFGRFLHEGFETEAELLRALEEFSHIEECEWARQMLSGFHRMAGD